MPTTDLSITMDDGMTAVAPGAATSHHRQQQRP